MGVPQGRHQEGVLEPRVHPDVWASGAAYEPYVGRWSRLVARDFVRWLAMPPGGRWLDIGCGTGALTQTILQDAAPSRITGIDPSEGYIAFARQHVVDARVRFLEGDAHALPVEAGTCDAVVAGLVLNFLPDPGRAIGEMVRATRAGGLVAVYVWDYAAGMQIMRHFWDAAVTLDPAAAGLDEGRRFSLCNPESLTALFHGAGLGTVAVRAIDVPTHFRDFDDYWMPFLGGQGPAPGYALSLDEEHRAVLRDRLRDRMPIAADGSMQLIARAWAACGVRQRAHEHL